MKFSDTNYSSAPYVPSPRSWERSEFRRVKSFWRRIEYTDVTRAFLSYRARRGGRKVPETWGEEHYRSIGKQCLKVDTPRRDAMRAKTENSRVNPRRDFRFTLYRDLTPANRVNFHESGTFDAYLNWSRGYSARNARTFQRTIRS